MATRFYPGARPRPAVRRQDAVPLQIQREVEDQPIYQPPPRMPIPGFAMSTRRLALQEQTEYAKAGWGMLNAVRARGQAVRAQSEANQIAEQATYEHQQRNLQAINRAFMPTKASAHYLQAAAFRGTGDLSEIEKEAREAEGRANLMKFQEWYDEASPQERTYLGGVHTGLIKERMSAEDYADIVDASKRDDDSVYKYDKRQREAANRVLQTSIQSVPGGSGIEVDSLPQIPTDDERETPGYRSFLKPSTYVDAAKGAGRFAKGVAAVTGVESIVRPGHTKSWDEIKNDWNNVFLGEQEAVTPLTRPIINESLRNLGMSEGGRDWVDRNIAPYIVPSTFVGGGSGGKVATRIGRRFLVEGTINMLQGDAAAEYQERERADWEKLVDFAAGGALAGVAPEVVGPLFKRAGELKNAVRLGGEEGALRVGKEAAEEITEEVGEQGRGTLRIGDDRLEYRTTPEGIHVDDVTVQVEGQGTGTRLLDDAVRRARVSAPDAAVTADLNSESGARLFAKQAGAEFTEFPSGRSLTPEEAIQQAAERKGPQVTLKAAPEVPRVANLTDDDLATRGLVSAQDIPAPTGAAITPGMERTPNEGFLLPDGRFITAADQNDPVYTLGLHEGLLERLGFLPKSEPIGTYGAPVRPYAETAKAFEDAYDEGLVRVVRTPPNSWNIATNSLDQAQVAVGKIANVDPNATIFFDVYDKELGQELSSRATASIAASRGLRAAAGIVEKKLGLPGKREGGVKGLLRDLKREGGGATTGGLPGGKKPRIKLGDTVAEGVVESHVKGKPGMVYVRKPNLSGTGKGRRVMRTLKKLTPVEAAPEVAPKVEAIEAKVPTTAAEQLDYNIHRVRFKPGDDAFERLAHLVRTSKRLSREGREVAHQRLLEQVGQAKRQAGGVVATTTRKPGELSQALKGGLKGERKPPLIDPMRPKFNDDELVAMEDALREAYPIDTKPLDLVSALDARDRLLDGYPLAPHQVKLLEPILPKNALEHISNISRGFWKRAAGEALELLNIARVLQTPGDISSTLRQEFLMVTMHPKKWGVNIGRKVRMLFDGKYTEDVSTAIKNDPLYETLKERGLAVDAVEEYARVAPGQVRGTGQAVIEERLTTGEKTMIGAFLGKVPIIKQSQRSYSVGLAAIRFDVGREAYQAARKAGATVEEIDDYMKAINAVSGRGTLLGAEKYGAPLAQLAYAPRWVTSRFQVPYTALFGSKYARKYAAHAMLRGAGLMGTTLVLAKLSGADIELDPRSSDFGKIKIGGTRIDVSGGYAPLIRFATRIGTQTTEKVGLTEQGGYKTPLGEIEDLDLRKTIETFVESKAAPGPGLAADIWKGETFTGERLSANPDTFKREAFNRLTPLMVQSVVEAVKEEGWPHGPLGLGEFIGLGVQTYTPASIEIEGAIGDDIQRGVIKVEDYPELDGRGPRTRAELHPADARAFADSHNDLILQQQEHFAHQPETVESAAFDQAKLIDTEATSTVSDLASQAESGAIEYKTFREGVSTVKASKRAGREVIDRLLESAGQNPDERPNKAGLVRDLYDYGQIFDQFPNADVDDVQQEDMFESLATFKAGLGLQRETALDANMNLGFKEVPLYAEMEADGKKIRDSGYFDRYNTAWEDTRQLAEQMGDSLPANQAKYEQQVLQQSIAEYGSIDGPMMAKKDYYTRYFDKSVAQELSYWKYDNSDTYELVIKWGHPKGEAAGGGSFKGGFKGGSFKPGF